MHVLLLLLQKKSSNSYRKQKIFCVMKKKEKDMISGETLGFLCLLNNGVLWETLFTQ